MRLNLKYYKGQDKYSDGDIEDKIIGFIKKYPNNYEEAFKENSSWPVFYHLSNIRKNVISWYPFKKNASILEVGAGMGAITEELCKKCKKVTSIELSKRRATAILERNKDANNLEIYVGNFEDIQLEEMYDYILLNGVLEYGALYINSDKPYEDFINKLKKNLKKDGKILIAIENRFGLKYWCGANEDHTGLPFDGINGYMQNNNIKTFSKEELQFLAKRCNLSINFYYMFPDYKFPKVIYTDKSLEKNIYSTYSPYYCERMNMLVNESKLYREILANKTIPFFANSYFIELSVNKEDPKIEFVKFNNDYRTKQYNVCTYLKDNKFFKKALNEEAMGKINDIKQIDKLLEKQNIPHAKIVEAGNEIYSKQIKGESLTAILTNYYKENNLDKIFEIYDSIYELIEKSSGKKIKYSTKNVFDKYGVKIKEDELKKLHFYEYGTVDINPDNIVVSNNQYILIDQEWIEENSPIEYTMYRAIANFFYQFEGGIKVIDKVFERYHINAKTFKNLEEKFYKDVRSTSFKVFQEHYVEYNFIHNINELKNTNDRLHSECKKLQNENRNLQDTINHKNIELLEIVNSKRYKFISKVINIRDKFLGIFHKKK